MSRITKSSEEHIAIKGLQRLLRFQYKTMVCDVKMHHLFNSNFSKGDTWKYAKRYDGVIFCTVTHAKTRSCLQFTLIGIFLRFWIILMLQISRCSLKYNCIYNLYSTLSSITLKKKTRSTNFLWQKLLLLKADKSIIADIFSKGM